MLGFLKKLRRRELLSAPFPDEWERVLRSNFLHYIRLTEEERDKLGRDLRIFIAEKDWEGCGGQEITDEVKVTIAGQACLLTLRHDGEPYPNVTSVLVYPTGYIAPERRVRPGGIVDERKSHRLGEAWSHGPIVLSWADALQGGRDEFDGSNLVFHEFAHKLDMRAGEPNGVPRLGSSAQYDSWAEVMSAEFEQLAARSHRWEATLLDQYGSKDPAEFFAVATECFFERPIEMQEQHPQLYGVLRDYFRQDPAKRLGILLTRDDGN